MCVDEATRLRWSSYPFYDCVKILFLFFNFYTHKAHLFFHFFGLWISHRIVKAVYADPETYMSTWIVVLLVLYTFLLGTYIIYSHFREIIENAHGLQYYSIIITQGRPSVSQLTYDNKKIKKKKTYNNNTIMWITYLNTPQRLMYL